jgi:hypothetical protein
MKRTEAVNTLRDHFAGRTDIDILEFQQAVLALRSKVPPDLRRKLIPPLCRLREQAERVQDSYKLEWAEKAMGLVVSHKSKGHGHGQGKQSCECGVSPQS